MKLCQQELAGGRWQVKGRRWQVVVSRWQVAQLSGGCEKGCHYVSPPAGSGGEGNRDGKGGAGAGAGGAGILSSFEVLILYLWRFSHTVKQFQADLILQFDHLYQLGRKKGLKKMRVWSPQELAISCRHSLPILCSWRMAFWSSLVWLSASPRPCPVHSVNLTVTQTVKLQVWFYLRTNIIPNIDLVFNMT